MVDFPNDPDGDVLRRLEAQGIDLTQPRDIDFYCYAKNAAVAEAIADKMTELGFKTSVFEGNDDPSPQRFSVYGARKMIPRYEDLIRVQRELNLLLADFDTFCDGWGTLSD